MHFIAVMMISLMTLWECGSAASSKPEAEPEAQKPAPLDQEAEIEAQKYLGMIFNQCGDDYFSKEILPPPAKWASEVWQNRPAVPDYYVFRQYHQLSTTITPHALTAADTLNGIEWRGTLTMSASAMREFAHRGQSSALSKENVWSDWSGMNAFPPTMYLIKQRGQWEVKSPYPWKDKRDQNVSAPDCATIPQ